MKLKTTLLLLVTAMAFGYALPVQAKSTTTKRSSLYKSSVFKPSIFVSNKKKADKKRTLEDCKIIPGVTTPTECLDQELAK